MGFRVFLDGTENEAGGRTCAIVVVREDRREELLDKVKMPRDTTAIVVDFRGRLARYFDFRRRSLLNIVQPEK